MNNAQVFESLYRGDSPPPWDLSAPTPFVTKLEADRQFAGRVLDAGCGTGENALFLASRGHRVVGIDAAPTAIARARAKAVERRLETLTFVEADATQLPGYVDAFDSVLDCGFFHVLAPSDQAQYVAALNRACTRQAVLHLMAFSDRNAAMAEQVPAGCFTHGVSEAELRAAFSPNWELESLEGVQQPLRGTEVHFWQARLRRRH